MKIGIQGILFVLFVVVYEVHSEKSASPGCKFSNGDVKSPSGIPEIDLGETAETEKACESLVIKKKPTATGATWNPGNKKCYAEFGNTIATSTVYRACLFQTSDDERVAALEAKYRNICKSLQNLCNAILISTNGDYSCCANPDTAKVVCLQTVLAGPGLSSTSCTAEADLCSGSEATSPGGDTLSRIEVLKTKAANVGISLASMCGPIDFVAHTAVTRLDCCANPENSETRCVDRVFSAGSITQGTAGACLSSDVLCNTDNGEPQDDLATLEAKAASAAVSLGSTCGAVEIMANGVLDCCANSENGQMACVEPALSGGLISGGTTGVCPSTDALCNRENNEEK